MGNKLGFATEPRKNGEFYPSIEELEQLLPHDYCAIQWALAENAEFPEERLVEVQQKMKALEERIHVAQEQEATRRAEWEAQEEIDRNRSMFSKALRAAGYALAAPIILPIGAVTMLMAFSDWGGSEMMQINLEFLKQMEKALQRGSDRKVLMQQLEVDLDARHPR